MNKEKLKLQYPINSEYLISGYHTDPNVYEKVELQRIDGISGFVEFIDRPLSDSFRYREVTIFNLKRFIL